MLANNLTLDDEEAVQTELRAMQKDIMKETPIELPAAPRTQPRTSVEQGVPVFVFTTLSDYVCRCHL